MKESRKKLLKGIVTAAAAAGAVYGMNRLVFFLSTMKDLLTSKEKSYYNWRFGDIYYARKGVELCDGINADNNAQLNGMIRDSKRMFQEYINQNAQKVPEKAKKKGFFSRLFSR